MTPLQRFVFRTAAPAPVLLALLAGCASSTDRSGTAEDPSASAPSVSPGAISSNTIRTALVANEPVEAPQIPMGNPATIDAIIDEGLHRNRVMDHLIYLTENFGARLTASSSLEQANRWSAQKFREWGLTGVELQEWNRASLRFDRGPSRAVAMIPVEEGDPRTTREFEFSTLAWTVGTQGPVRGEIVKMPETPEAAEALRDRLSGAWVLITPEADNRLGIRGVTGQMNARRSLRDSIHESIANGEPSLNADHVSILTDHGGVYSGTIAGPGIDENNNTFVVEMTISASGRPRMSAGIPDLSTAPIYDLGLEDNNITFHSDAPAGTFHYMLQADDAGGLKGVATLNQTPYQITLTREESLESETLERYHDWASLRTVLEAGPAGFIASSRDERVWTSSTARGEDLLKLTMDDVSPDIEIVVRESDYDHVNSKLADGQTLMAEIDLDHTLTPGPIPLYNTIAEIRGTEFPDEVVIISAHLDSWNGPGSTGTVDNGTGSAVTMEAARILATVGARPKRTIRFILWTGEEQGLMGARAYVASLSQDELDKISAVFVDDGGTNYQGGIPAADFMVDYLAAATAPTNSLFTSPEHTSWARADDDPSNDHGFMNVNIRPTGDKIQTHSGSDHAAFNAVGVPGFFWDEVGRASYWEAWHTQNDTIDQAIPEYLRQSATNSAITAYNLASAPGLLPRTGQVRTQTAQDADAIETQIGTRR